MLALRVEDHHSLSSLSGDERWVEALSFPARLVRGGQTGSEEKPGECQEATELQREKGRESPIAELAGWDREEGCMQEMPWERGGEIPLVKLVG